MRSWIYFILFVFFLGCVSNSLNRRNYAFLDAITFDSLRDIAVSGADPSNCIVPEYNFLDTCEVAFVRHLHIDTTRISLRDKLSVIQTGDPELNSKIRTKAHLFYLQKGLKTEWLELDAPLEQFYVFAEQVKQAYTYGLDPRHYQVDELESAIQRLYLDPARSYADVTDLDVRITGSFFLFTTHLIEGRIPAEGNDDFIWLRDKPREDDIELLLSIKSEEQMKERLQALHPVHPQYQKLEQAFVKYRRLAATNASPSLVSTARIFPGEVHSSIPAIRKRLELTDLERYGTVDDSLRYDDALVAAVKQFQYRHGLLSDGIIGPNTLRELDVSFTRKAELIALNLERLRWLPNDVPDDYISINVPEYKLRIYNRENKVLEMKVVIGSSFSSTPVFSDTLEYIVFSPTWTVPYSIIEGEIIPRLRKDSLYYQNRGYTFYKNGIEIDPSMELWDREGLSVYSYKVVQEPGPYNALGLVKFIMPNNMYIYLHDTPADQLFDRSDRALSHGCIRLENPISFARYLLRHYNEWDEKRIIEAMYSMEPKTVYLKEPYHVQIEYRSVWVDDGGLVHFRPDIYGHDERQLRRLKTFTGASVSVLQ